ncbi:hypothetical protein NLG97_g10371 [Lecanicillium saksenae]|uniref:Uncharacterized protein n=1 Tax=Lecanicillium saksenae TaxID=468837 RepID=A0ACC1QF79_9HYPO|nr:hypothetical protein NLG97_g10371 [Lecanicillium saksenae]
MLLILTSLAALISFARTANADAPADALHQSSGTASSHAEVPMIRSYFYVGGKYITQGDDDKNHVLIGQMYVEKLVPAQGASQPHPIVLLHGRGQTGTVSQQMKFSDQTPIK